MTQDPRKLDERELQTKTRSLRALARSLVADEHDAEDLVQETWITALDHPSKTKTRLGAWLAGVTKMHARQHHRTQKRRNRRERQAARPEAIPADDSIDQLDTLRHILDQVRDMDEPYRSTLLFRFFDELSPQEIAERQGVPYATVRTRLHRALEKLRRRMDAASGGNREAWVAPLLPFISAGAALTTAAAATAGSGMVGTGTVGSGTTATVATGLQLKLGIVAAALALGAGTWFALPLLDSQRGDEVVIQEGDRAETQLPGTAVSQKVAESAKPAKLGGEEPGSQRREVEILTRHEGEPAPEGLRFTVQVRVTSAETGKGIAGARIRIGKAEGFETDGGGLLEQELFLPSAKKTKAESLQAKKLAAQARKAGKKSGLIAQWSNAKNRSFWIHARAKGFVGQWKEGKIPDSGSPLSLEFALERGLEVTGRVVDVDGQGIEGAWVRTFRKLEQKILTDEEGRFRIDDLDPSQERLYLFASAKGFAGKGRSISSGLEEDRRDIRIVLQRGSRIFGVVRGPDRRPVQGARLELWSKDKISAVTDAKGAFELLGVGTGKQRLVVRHEDHAQLVRRVDVQRAGQDLEMDLRLQRGRILSGRIRDEGGRPVAHAQIHIRSAGSKVGDSESDERGQFELKGLPSSAVDLYISAKGFVPLWFSGLMPGQQPVDLELTHGAGLAGRVFDENSGQPIQKFRVRILGPTRTRNPGASVRKGKVDHQSGKVLPGQGMDLGKWVGTTLKIDDPEGHWNTGKLILPEGIAVTLSIQAEGYAEKRIASALTSIHPHPEDLPVGMERGTRLLGRIVVASNSAAVSHARIRVVPPGESLNERGFVKTRLRSARSGTDGRFELDNLSSGSHRLAVEHADWGLSIHTIEVPPGKPDHRVILRLTSQATLQGLAFDLEGQPYAKKPVQLFAEQVPGLRTRTWKATTDALGRFEFLHLPRGIYRLSAVEARPRRPMQLFGRYVSILGTEVQETELRPGGTLGIRGTIRATFPLPPSLIVSLTPRYEKDTPWVNREAPRHVRAQGGTFSFRALPKGSYTLGVVVYVPEQGGMFSAKKTVEVRGSSNVVTEIRLSSTGNGK